MRLELFQSQSKLGFDFYAMMGTEREVHQQVTLLNFSKWSQCVVFLLCIVMFYGVRGSVTWTWFW